MAVTLPDGTPLLYDGGLLPDVSRAEVRKWWEEQLKVYTDVGVEGFWNDANEMGWNRTPPIDATFNGYKSPKSFLEVLNLRALNNAKATYEGVNNIWQGKKRVFNLSRGGWAGIQKYAGLWTGDIASDDANIVYGDILMQSLGLSGVPYVGADAGGFFDDTNRELYTRWVTQASFTPFFRVHTNFKNRFTEPFNMGEEVEQIVKKYIELRYCLLPYIYSGYYKSHTEGLPLMIPQLVKYPADPFAYSKYQLQYFWGQSMLVAPTKSNENLKKVYLIGCDYTSLHTNEKFTKNTETIIESPADKLPVFIEESAIIPTQRLVQTTMNPTADTLFIHIFGGKKENTFTLYEDDGITNDYLTDGFNKREIVYKPQIGEVLIGAVSGKYKSHFKTLGIITHNFELKTIQANGQKYQSQLYNAGEGLSHFKGFSDYGSAFYLDNINSKITIKFN